MGKQIDIAAQYGLDVEIFSVSLNDNTAYTLPTGIISPARKPVGAVFLEMALPSGILLESYNLGVDANSAPQITAQFTSNTNGIYCTIAILYKR